CVDPIWSGRSRDEEMDGYAPRERARGRARRARMRPGVSSLRIGGGCALRSRGVVSPALALAAVGLVLATGAAARSAIAAPPSAGEAAPAFSLDTTAGATVTLGSLRGRLVVLHFWATWCGACRREMPLLQEI